MDYGAFGKDAPRNEQAFEETITLLGKEGSPLQAQC